MQIDVLSGLAETLTKGVQLTQAERAELFAVSLRMVASRSATEREAAATPESAPARE